MLLPRYFVFLSLTPRPPRSTLFPYTTLFRSNTLLRSSSTAVVISPPLGFAPFTRPSSTALLSLGHDSSRGLKKPRGDRKSTRLNSSHTVISYAVFCLKKNKAQTAADW